MAFVRRNLSFTFSYGTGTEGNGPPTTKTITGLRATANIVLAGGLSMGQADVRIFGMTLSDMNELSTLGSPVSQTRKNTLTIEAGDEGATPAKIYSGTLYSAWADLNSAPDFAFNVSAQTGLIDQMVPAPATSFKVDVDAAEVMGGFAKAMGYAFENNGVSVILPKPAFNGTLRAQAASCAVQANIDWVIDVGTLAIWPKNGSRTTNAEVTIGPDNGMVGYPGYTANGLQVRALFDPRFRFGQLVTVNSILPTSSGQATSAVGQKRLPVDGKWKVVTLMHDLASQFPGGGWFTEMMLVVPGYAVVPQAGR